MDTKKGEVKVSYTDSKSMWKDFEVRGMPKHFEDSDSRGVHEAIYNDTSSTPKKDN